MVRTGESSRNGVYTHLHAWLLRFSSLMEAQLLGFENTSKLIVVVRQKKIKDVYIGWIYGVWKSRSALWSTFPAGLLLRKQNDEK